MEMKVLVWVDVFGHGRTKLVQVNCCLNGKKYVKMIEGKILPRAEDHLPINWRFEQNNAPVHSSNVAKNYFLRKIQYSSSEVVSDAIRP